MMPGLLTRMGLYEALIDLFDKVNDTEEIKVETNIPDDLERLDENKEIMLYRIIQEVVNNTLKHAQAKNLEFSVARANGNLEVLYKDDGKGFDVKEKLESKTIGLKSIQSRVNFMNGGVEIYSQPGEGTKYKFTIPIS
jgi:signal transduction histidine kinase